MSTVIDRAPIRSTETPAVKAAAGGAPPSWPNELDTTDQPDITSSKGNRHGITRHQLLVSDPRDDQEQAA
ncbi:MAG: hypothetical protein R2754_12055 [Microthrixaceae bacterium]